MSDNIALVGALLSTNYMVTTLTFPGRRFISRKLWRLKNSHPTESEESMPKRQVHQAFQGQLQTLRLLCLNLLLLVSIRVILLQ